MKQDKVSKLRQTNIFDLPDAIIPPDKRVFYPDWTNQPPVQETVITANSKRVLTVGNLLAFCSKAGVGKSSLCEAITASLINPHCDSLGFSVALKEYRRKVLYLDTERTIQDTWNAWERTYRRAGMKAPNIDKRVLFANLKAVSIPDRKKYVEQILNKNPDIGLIIFDGAGDFIRDTNSIAESCDFIDWINTFNPNISLVFSLHTNPRDDKPRGHIGSELCRRAESVFLVRKLDDGVREITTTFEYGKVRNDNDVISSYYRYSDNVQMFITTDYTPPKVISQEKQQEYSEMAEKIFEGRTECSTNYIVGKICEATGKIEPTSRTIFYRHFKDKLVQMNGTGWKLSRSFN